MTPALLAGLVSIAAAVRLEGTTSCPDPARVAQRLAEILPESTAHDDGEPPDVGRFWEEGDELVLELQRPSGAVLGTRRLARTFGCEELAAALAVSLAAWESDVHPQFAPAWTRHTPPAAVVAPARAPPAPAAPEDRTTVEVGAALGVGGSVDGPAVAGDAVLAGWLRAGGGRTALRLEFEAQSTRARALPDGRALWQRFSLGLGVERGPYGSTPVRDGRARTGGVSWFALARLGGLSVRGQGFPEDHTALALDPGLTAGARSVLGGIGDHWTFGVELAASLWPVRHDAVASGSGASERLPAGEVFLRLTVARGPGE